MKGESNPGVNRMRLSARSGADQRHYGPTACRMASVSLGLGVPDPGAPELAELTTGLHVHAREPK
jgi:hypothetical protein